MDWKAEYSALSSTRSQKKKLKQPTPVPLLSDINSSPMNFMIVSDIFYILGLYLSVS